MKEKQAISYRDAGVDIEEAARAVERIKRLSEATRTPGVVSGIGAFGAGFALKGFKNPILVSSTDGVGTKLKIAFLTGRHDTIGEDLVNHCVNDIAVQGARPLFFLDYFATGKLEAGVLEQVVEGISRGCRNNGCALIGGETAELPGFYEPGEYDLAGFIVGAVERRELITGAKIREGDALIGLPSTGLHTNGYSLARKLLFDVAGYLPSTYLEELQSTIADELLKVHRSYLRPIQALMDKKLLKGAAHITGGGITENTPRMLPQGLAAEIQLGSWPAPPIFELLRKIGRMSEDDYRRTFNLGIGVIFAVAQRNVGRAVKTLEKLGEKPYVMGRVRKRPRGTKEAVLYR